MEAIEGEWSLTERAVIRAFTVKLKYKTITV